MNTVTILAVRLKIANTKLNSLNRLSNQLLQKRNSGYYSSKFLDDIASNNNITTKYEITRNPDEWMYVERVLPLAVVPEPVKKSSYPSGWRMQGDNLAARPFIVARTKNHMLPVYLSITENGIVRQTIIKRIQGDIWQFERELRPFLADLIKPKPLRLQVNEFAGKITIVGDLVNAVKHWLTEKKY